MTEARRKKLMSTVQRRQLDLAVVLENVRDPHNIGAVLRSCDSVGIQEVFVLYTEVGLQSDYLTIGNRTSAGARHWVDVHYYTDAAACFAVVKQKYRRVLSAFPHEQAVSLFQLDLSLPTAFLFGNERDGISAEALAYSNGNFWIPQAGMAASLNISVACAVTLYETYRQRDLKGKYAPDNTNWTAEKSVLLQDFIARQTQRETALMIKKEK